MRKLFSSKTKVIHEVQVRETSLKLVKGNICNERSEAIIIGNNRDLTGENGVSSAVMSSGGEQLVNQSRGWVLKNGRVPYGKVAVTSGGSLYSLNVVHAICPKFSRYSHGFEDLFRTTVVNAFSKCDELYAKTVSFAVFTSEEFDFPRENSAALQIESIISYISEHAMTRCEEIRVVVNDKEKALEFLSEFEQRWGPATDSGKGLFKKAKKSGRPEFELKEKDDVGYKNEFNL